MNVRRVVAMASALAITAATAIATFAPVAEAESRARKSRTRAASAPAWASASTATIHPGVQTFTDGGQCTSNFVFYDATEVYLGQAAHCAGTEGNTAVNGCEAGSLPLGTRVGVDGASRPGTLVYSSWLSMQAAKESNEDLCYGNDLALVRLDAADRDNVNPSVPHWGGPVGLAADVSPLEQVFSYGNSSLRSGLTLLSPKQGYVVRESDGGWTHNVYTVTPGVPGDSGSAFLDADGRALGVLSTLQLAPLAASNGVSDLPRMLQYLERVTAFRVTLARGTEPFVANPLPNPGDAST